MMQHLMIHMLGVLAIVIEVYFLFYPKFSVVILDFFIVFVFSSVIQILRSTL